jgi:hypothetical protein
LRTDTIAISDSANTPLRTIKLIMMSSSM